MVLKQQSKMNALFIVLTVFILASKYARCSDHSKKTSCTSQQRLMKDLFTNPQFDRRARPVINSTTPVHVKIRLNLYQLVEVDERSQHVVVYAWVTQLWNDSMLTWAPENYENITSIVVPYWDIWLPDTYLYNSLKMARQDSEHWLNAILEADNSTEKFERDVHSRVVFRFPALYKFMCSMRVTTFPFDTQYCRMIFGSWTFDAGSIIYTPEAQTIAQEDYQENEEWTVVKVTAREELEIYSCCQNPFSFIYVDIVLKRRPLHYMVNLFVPILIVSTIANIGFFSPSSTNGEREQRVCLGMSTLLALSIILMMVSDRMPITSTSVPLVGRFFVGMMLETAVALLATTAVLFIHQRGNYGYRVPSWIRRIMFRHVARILGVKRRKPKITNSSVCQYTAEEETIPNEDSNFNQQHIFKNSALAQLCMQVAQLRFVLARKYKHLELDDDPVKLDWEWLASILDRMFLLLSLISVTLLCGLIVVLGLVQHFLI